MQSSLRCLILTLIWGAVASSTGFAQAYAQENEQKAIAFFDQIVEEKGALSQIWGIVCSDSLTLVHSQGLSSQKKGWRLHDTTRFQVASLSKPIVAMAILRLVASGKLRLEDEVSTLLPEIQLENPFDVPVQVQHLLEHSSGMPDMPYSEYFPKDREVGKPLAALMQSRSYSLRLPPGTCAIYSNTGYALLGLIVERQSGKPFPQAVKSLVFDPLGMEFARFGQDSGTGLARGHHHRRELAPDKPHTYEPAIGMQAALVDLEKFVKYLLFDTPVQGQKLLPDSLRNRLFSVHTTLAANKGYPFGYTSGLKFTHSNNLQVYGHSGAMQGYRAHIRIIPSQHAGFIALSNDEGFDGDRVEELTEMFIWDRVGKRRGQIGGKTPDAKGYYARKNARNPTFSFLTWLTGGVFISQGNPDKTIYWPAKSDRRQILIDGGWQIYDWSKDRWAGIMGEDASLGLWMQFEDEFYVKSPYAWVLTWQLILLIAIVLQSIFAIVALIRLLASLWGHEIRIGRVLAAILPILTLLMIIFIARGAEAHTIGSFGMGSASIFGLSLIYPAVCLWAWRFAFARNQSRKRVLVWRLFAVMNTLVIIFMIYWGLVGIILW